MRWLASRRWCSWRASTYPAAPFESRSLRQSTSWSTWSGSVTVAVLLPTSPKCSAWSVTSSRCRTSSSTTGTSKVSCPPVSGQSSTPNCTIAVWHFLRECSSNDLACWCRALCRSVHPLLRRLRDSPCEQEPPGHREAAAGCEQVGEQHLGRRAVSAHGSGSQHGRCLDAARYFRGSDRAGVGRGRCPGRAD